MRHKKGFPYGLAERLLSESGLLRKAEKFEKKVDGFNFYTQAAMQAV